MRYRWRDGGGTQGRVMSTWDTREQELIGLGTHWEQGRVNEGDAVQVLKGSRLRRSTGG